MYFEANENFLCDLTEKIIEKTERNNLRLKSGQNNRKFGFCEHRHSPSSTLIVVYLN